MTLQEVKIKLDSLFIARYSKKEAQLNRNVYPSAINDNGSYEVPSVVMSNGGGTILKGNNAGDLNPPAVVQLVQKNMKAEKLVYRIAIPFHECEIAARTPEYFNYLFDDIFEKALTRYRMTIGDENKIRFGSHYLKFTSPTDPSSVFLVTTTEDMFELRFHSSYASSEEDYS
jgi:hypothetical protein